MVGYDFHRGRWRARARDGENRRVDLGRFLRKEDAEQAYERFRLDNEVRVGGGPTAREERRLKGSVFSKARKRAEARGLDFTIDRLDYPVPERCPVLGLPLDWSDWNHTPTLDRVDNSLGYIPGNVVVISMRANALKGDASLEELEALVRYVKSHNGSLFKNARG